MFGRHLKKEYKMTECCLYDRDTGKPIGTKNTSLEDPILAIGGFALVLFLGGSAILYIVLPWLNINLPDTVCYSIQWVLGVAGVFLGYHLVSEPDESVVDEDFTS